MEINKGEGQKLSMKNELNEFQSVINLVDHQLDKVAYMSAL